MSQIYDARTGTYIRGGTSSADPGGESVYHVDDWQNASSYKDPSNPRSVSYPATDSVGSNVVNNTIAEAANASLEPTYMNGYSALADAFLGAFNSNNSMIHDLIANQMNLSERNSALSQEMADKANAFSSNEAALARAWSGQQAKINRDWQTEMSNTAHQREVADLIASGLNPILSANNGASTGNSGIPGASMAQSHQGQVDTTSAYGMATSLMESMMNSAVQMKGLEVQQAMQEKSLDLSRAQMINDLTRTQLSAEAQKSAASTSAYGQITAARTSAEAQKYRADIDQQIAELRDSTDRYVADLQSETAHDTSPVGFWVDAFEHPEKFAKNVGNLVGFFADSFSGNKGFSSGYSYNTRDRNPDIEYPQK